MTNSSENVISRNKLMALLKELQKNSSSNVKNDIKFTEYNWHKPRHFSIEQLSALKIFSEKIAEHIQADLTNLCHGDFRVTATSITEHFSYTLEKDFYNSDQNYYLTLDAAGKPQQGFISISKKSGLSIVRFMLCEDDEQNVSNESENDNISTLEESLLLDATTTAIQALSKTSHSREGLEFKHGKTLLRGNWPLDLDNLEELSRIDFKIETKNITAEISLIIVSEHLEPALRMTFDSSNLTSKEEINRAIMNNLGKVSVKVRSIVSRDLIPFQEITSLEPGDVIVLSKSCNEPLDLIVNKTPTLSGNIGTLKGRYALTITNKEEN